MTGANIPPITAHTEWIFLEAINTLKFVEPWDIGDFGQVLERLKANGYYLFQGEIIKPSLGKRRQPSRSAESLPRAAFPPTVSGE